jgi:hypothetical protein
MCSRRLEFGHAVTQAEIQRPLWRRIRFNGVNPLRAARQGDVLADYTRVSDRSTCSMCLTT